MTAVACDGERLSQCMRSFAAIHDGCGVHALIPNVHARVETLSTAAGPLPATVHDAGAGDAWICSPRSTYVDYAAQEAQRYMHVGLGPWTTRVIASIGTAVEWSGLDRAVALNNWLLSTNLYPPLGSIDLSSLMSEAVKRWPGYTLWFRSLNTEDNTGWLEALRAAGCNLVAARQVYFYSDVASAVDQHHNLRRDLALLRQTSLTHSPDHSITEADYPRIAELYHMLYIRKYSGFNPVYSADFLARWHRAGLLAFEGFRDGDGRLASVVGIFRLGQTATAPIVGYDTAQPRRAGLYRLATGCAYRACIEHGWRLNLSAGAAEFKRLRGGHPLIEYSAVYARHLPRRTRHAVALLSAATCRIGAPLLGRYRL